MGPLGTLESPALHPPRTPARRVGRPPAAGGPLLDRLPDDRRSAAILSRLTLTERDMVLAFDRSGVTTWMAAAEEAGAADPVTCSKRVQRKGLRLEQDERGRDPQRVDGPTGLWTNTSSGVCRARIAPPGPVPPSCRARTTHGGSRVSSQVTGRDSTPRDRGLRHPLRQSGTGRWRSRGAVLHQVELGVAYPVLPPAVGGAERREASSSRRVGQRTRSHLEPTTPDH
ncbi:hypothetical protein GCM10010505_29320 [Kitasatospora aburaviensis]